MKFKNVLFAATMLVSSLSLASQVDISDDFVNDFTNKFTNRCVDGKKTWDYTKNQLSVKAAGIKLSDSIGYTIIAKGEVSAHERIFDEGQLVLLEMPEILGITKGGSFLLGKIKMDFRYEGRTTAEKYIHPGHIWVESPWGTLHPKGTIHIIIESNYGTNVRINIFFTADEDRKDRPGMFTRELTSKLKHLAKETVESFANENGVYTYVDMKD